MLLLPAAPQPAGAQSPFDIHPDEATFAIDRARLLTQQQRYDEAREVLIDVLAIAGLSPETRAKALLARGTNYFAYEDYSAAKRDFQAVIDLPGVSAQLKKSAQYGLEMTTDFEKIRALDD
jgi:hypothetical protein